MRPERNPLDLNNLPEDSARDGRQVLEDSSSIAPDGGNDAKDDCGKVYECRFCSLKFCKSQALGGHMNRHRQERETETLNRARQLVYNNDNLLPPQGVHHIGSQQMQHGGFHQGSNLSEPTMQHFRPIYPTRLYSGSSTTHLPPLPPPPNHQSYMYASPSRFAPFPSQYPSSNPANDYIIGHALSGNANPNYVPAPSDTR